MSLLSRSIARNTGLARRALSQTPLVAKRYQDEEAARDSQLQKEGKAQNHTKDAIHAAHGPEGSKPDVTAQRQQNTQASSGGFQPGQLGEQVSGHGGGEGQEVGGAKEATPPSFVESVKQKLGMGNQSHQDPSTRPRSFSTSAFVGAKTDPSKLHGEQNEHNVHSEAGKPDKNEATRNNAELPSKTKKPSGSKAGKHPMADNEALGYGSAPEGLSGKSDGKSGPEGGKRNFSTSAFRFAEPARHSPDGLPDYVPAKYDAPAGLSHVTPSQGSSRDQFKRTYVRGQPEPSSHRIGYTFVDYSTPEAYHAPMPSSAVPPSSTSTDAANPKTTGEELASNDLKLPPDFDTEVRGQWMQKPADQEKELPPAGAEPSGGTRDLRAEPRGPRDAEQTTDKEMSPAAPHSDSATVAKAQAAEAKGADPASTSGHKHSPEAKPAFPEDVFKEGQAETTLTAAGAPATAGTKARKTRSGPTKGKK